AHAAPGRLGQGPDGPDVARGDHEGGGVMPEERGYEIGLDEAFTGRRPADDPEPPPPDFSTLPMLPSTMPPAPPPVLPPGIPSTSAAPREPVAVAAAPGPVPAGRLGLAATADPELL